MPAHHRSRVLVGLGCALALVVPSASPSLAASRVAPVGGTLYVGSATEDGQDAGAVSLRVGPGATSVVSLLGGRFHGDLCTPLAPYFAGPGGINPAVVSLAADGRFSGTQVSAAPDGARVAGTLHGVFAPSGATVRATLSYSYTPVSGATQCTVTATLSLHRAPATPTGKRTPPRTNAAYAVVTHQGWTGTVVTDRTGKRAVVRLSGWDVCHYTDLPAVHFLYPEPVRVTAAVAHGRWAAHLRSSGTTRAEVTVTGEFVGPRHQLAGALHVRRTGMLDGNAYTCDTSRVLFSAP